ncbi:diacylglycerol kinase family protein [Lactobacillus sp. LC28-10]|uniref:Diacylglycerol kinase family protein n=1 Tax=Secundilactobacillus angelensis TaxID=2722706 RepID=A0ABX1KZJ7_9LACO|nr:diacylglycerol kinase family protein [Secundilactobacillus angelensis]MCH5461308.1 diacylglycerol kinase family protein [Secundilactobacillus angelensis]NLR17496.1 diacylglycerol kinase family protein [Secundilactobacillus angelensis]
MGLNDKQVNKNRNFFQSLMHALGGVYSLVSTERNFRKHITLAVIAIIMGIWLQLTINEWLWITLAIFVVVVAEVLNTVVESIVDLIVGHHYHDEAKKAKDVAAGGVLIAAIFALVIGCLIFIPELMHEFHIHL